MATFSAGSTVTLSLDADDVVTFVGTANWNLTPTTGSKYQGYTTGTQYFGPYGQFVSIAFTCLSDGSITQTSDTSRNTHAVYVNDAYGNPIGVTGASGRLVSSFTDQGTGASVSSGYIGGSTAWTKLYGPNELRQSPWGGSSELTTPSNAFAYVTAASGSSGPAMFRREGASMMIDGGVLLANTGAPTFGNLRTFTAGISAGTLTSKTIAVLVYVHRMPATLQIKMRLGTDSSNYAVYQWSAANGEVIEGWNVLMTHTGTSVEPIGSGLSTSGQHSFHTSSVINDGWTVGAGSISSFAGALGYCALEVANMNARAYLWFEGVYYGGQDKPQITLGFDIQGSGLDTAKAIMDTYGLKGYAAVPTGNGVTANPEYLWTSAVVSRLQGLWAAGWDIVQHSVSHNSLGSLTDDSMILAEYESCREQIKAIGCWSGMNLYASPNNSFSNRTVALSQRAGINWGRHGINAPMFLSRGLVGFANPLCQGAYSIANFDSQASQSAEIARRLAFVDLCIAYGVSGHLYTHSVVSSASTSTDTNSTVFTAICAGLATRIAAGQIEVVTPSQMLRQSNTPDITSVYSNPNRLSLTAGSSPFDLINTTYRTLKYSVAGGTVSSITYSRDGSTFDATGQTAGVFDVAPGDRLRITYTGAPTIIQLAI